MNKKNQWDGPCDLRSRGPSHFVYAFPGSNVSAVSRMRASGDGALHLLGVLGQLAEYIGIQIEAEGHVHGHPAPAAIGAAAPAGGDAAGVAGGGGDRAAACTAIFPWRDSFLFLERLDI